MSTLTREQITSVKSIGFLQNKGTELFSGRIVAAGGVFTASQLHIVAECSEKFGNGKVAFTSRQCAELVGIPYDKIEPAMDFVKNKDPELVFGGTGAKVRPITACKGTTCIFGTFDTQKLAKELHNKYYLTSSENPLPHKFKIGIGGCKNSCMKPNLNDIGIQGVKNKGNLYFQIFVGGTWGKTVKIGDELPKLFTEEELYPVIEKCMEWFKANANTKERFGACIDRVGLENLIDYLNI